MRRQRSEVTPRTARPRRLAHQPHRSSLAEEPQECSRALAAGDLFGTGPVRGGERQREAVALLAARLSGGSLRTVPRKCRQPGYRRASGARRRLAFEGRLSESTSERNNRRYWRRGRRRRSETETGDL